MTVNDALIFSKLKKGGFPEIEAVVKSIQAVAHDQSPEIVEECEKENCAIL